MYELRTFKTDGDQIFGALYLDGDRISDWGWWPTNDEAEAQAMAVEAHKDGRLNMYEPAVV